MRVLAIETSCDETAIAIVETENGKTIKVLGNKVLSQIDIHKEYGGVFPMLAKREHARAIVPLLLTVLQEAGMRKKTSRHVIEHPLRDEFQEIMDREPEMYAAFINELPSVDTPDIDAILVTSGPGLEPALWVGINFAKALSMVWKKPIIPVNHMEGHMISSMLIAKDDMLEIPEVVFPVLGLLVSGGHTELVLMKEWGVYEIVGQTKDDAAGEAFDKVARILGLPYPGGPEISRLAMSGTPGTHELPRPMLHSKDFDFSFSGLKTSVLYLTKKLIEASGPLSDETRANIAKEFEEAVTEVLVEKTVRAAEVYGAQTILLGGGVSANKRLRERLAAKVAERLSSTLYIPHASLSTDNALMIAVAGLLKYRRDPKRNYGELKANGHWRLSAE